jgi:cysteine desulfurase
MTIVRTYLDYNATAPLRPEARAAMLAALDIAGNASSIHHEGRVARAIIEDAREQVAALVNAKPSEVVFTSGATEANVWALSAGWDAIYAAGIEHDSVLSPAKVWAPETVTLAVDRDGVIDLGALAKVLAAKAGQPGRRVIALQMANNETGVIEPVAEAAAIAAEHGVAVHSDAVQAAGRLPIDVTSLGVSTLAISAHKLGGPKGVGALIVRDGTLLRPLVSGGGQERRRRAGTENIAAIAGFGAAAAAAKSSIIQWARVKALRDGLEAALAGVTPSCVILSAGAPRLPNTVCVAVPGRLAETMVIKLDLAGIAVSAGAACSSGKVGASHVVEAMGLAESLNRSAVRISLGLETTEDDMARCLDAWRMAAGAPARAA